MAAWPGQVGAWEFGHVGTWPRAAGMYRRTIGSLINSKLAQLLCGVDQEGFRGSLVPKSFWVKSFR